MLQKPGIYFLFIGPGQGVGEMLRIDHIIVDQSKINVINRNLDGAALGLSRIKLFCIDNRGAQDSCQPLLQNLIYGNLQILVNGQINVVSGYRLHIVGRVRHLSHIIHENRLASLHSLQIGFHGFLYSQLSYGVVGIIVTVLIFLLKNGKLVLGNLSGIAQNMGEIHAVHIAADGILLDGDSLQIHTVFHNDRHGLLVNVCGYRGRHIFLETVVAHVIADGKDLKYLIFRVAVSGYKGIFVVLLGILPNPESPPAAEVIHHLAGCSRPLLFLQLVDGQMPVHICQETVKLCSLHRIGITSVFIQNNLEIADHRIAVILNHVDQLIDRRI